MSKIITTNIKGLTIRFAQKKDIQLILDFIKQLAEYEKLSHQVIADQKILTESLFGEHKFAEVIIADYNNKPVAFAIFFHNFSTFLGRPGIYLEDLFVKPEFRHKNIGKTMFTFLAHIADQRGCGRLEWAVLGWNKPAIDFYKKLGAMQMDEWKIFRVTGKNLTDLSRQYSGTP